MPELGKWYVCERALGVAVAGPFDNSFEAERWIGTFRDKYYVERDRGTELANSEVDHG